MLPVAGAIVTTGGIAAWSIATFTGTITFRTPVAVRTPVAFARTVTFRTSVAIAAHVAAGWRTMWTTAGIASWTI